MPYGSTRSNLAVKVLYGLLLDVFQSTATLLPSIMHPSSVTKLHRVTLNYRGETSKPSRSSTTCSYGPMHALSDTRVIRSVHVNIIISVCLGLLCVLHRTLESAQSTTYLNDTTSLVRRITASTDAETCYFCVNLLAWHVAAGTVHSVPAVDPRTSRKDPTEQFSRTQKKHMVSNDDPFHLQSEWNRADKDM